MPETSSFAQARQQARALAEAGDLAGARTVLDRAVEAGRPALAEGDPELLETMRQLAGLHAASGDPQAARRLLEEAASVTQRLGDTDPLTVMLAYDLAVVADQLANRHVARTHFTEVARSGPAAFGEDHWTVERARTYLRSTEPPPVPPSPTLTGSPAAQPAPPAPLVSGPPVPPTLPVSGPPVPPLVSSAATVSGPPGAPFVSTAPPISGWSASPPTGTAGPSVAEPPGGAVPPLAFGPPSRSRKSWIPAALGGVVGGAIVAVVVAVAVVRGGDGSDSAASVLPAPSSSPVPASVEAAPRSSAPAPTAPTSRPATTTTAPATVKPSTTKPSTVKPATKPPAVRTRIVSPRDNSLVPYPFDARFTVAPSDVAARETVVALLICVAGRCYLDGKLDIIGDGAAPYTIYLGSTRPEGAGVAWKLRLDRLPGKTYAKLVADRDAAIADGSWGERGTPMSALNPAPLSTLTVTKAP
ncbi:tetratricopeptide repeat protein [Paractinoplanes maris]|uniref:tetratricopeptide repeat protein n=1 Tax=Paractinoplanes maris TaxID=1734446 RepID=UPI002021D18C|nr:tetratricopeptide repeat protein [Actinoplanes maris]